MKREITVSWMNVDGRRGAPKKKLTLIKIGMLIGKRLVYWLAGTGGN
jgi:hypothetical protein